MLNHILASFAHFTALPFGKLKNIPADCKAKVFDFWSLVGWFTGGSMAIVYILASRLVSHPVALMLAIAARIAITAGREEKGLKTLSDKAGTDGNILLTIYFILMLLTMKELPSIWLPWLMISGDCLSKYCASFSVDILKPYSDGTDRYDKKSVATIIAGTLFGFAPLLLTLPEMFWIVGFAPIITSTLLHCTMSMRQHRFCNGDEGAIFLISELIFYIAAHSLIFTNSLQQHL